MRNDWAQFAPCEQAEEFDVVVVGGGPAGTVAAIQAGRLGARTALIEKNGILGGTTVSAGVNFPGLFHAWGRQVIAGIGWEIITAAASYGAAQLPDFSVKPRAHHEHQVLINKFVYAALLDDFCQAAGVLMHLHQMPVAVAGDEEWLRVLVAGKEGLSVLRTRKLVDATGDANVAAMMGYLMERSENLQPGTLVYRMDGYDIDKVDRRALQEIYTESLAAGDIRITDHCVSSGSVPFWHELVSGGGNCNHVPGVDGASSAGRTHAEIEGRRAIMRALRMLRRVPGCENLRISEVASECGIRESRRIVGEQRVSVAAYTSGHVWSDAICYSFYPIDVHHHESNTIDTRPLERGVVPTIPYGALIPRGSDALLVAGRCISGDSEASSAFRVQATCMATGQAAGAAAAVSAREQISARQVDVAALRALLEEQGAIVPSVERGVVSS